MLSRGLQMRWLSGAERAEAAGHGLWVVETSSQPCWILVHLCRSHKSQGQRSKGKVKGDAPGSLERLGEACLGYFYSTSRCYLPGVPEHSRDHTPGRWLLGWPQVWLLSQVFPRQEPPAPAP